jgi:ataxia telangiectasia mutated family protein
VAAFPPAARPALLTKLPALDPLGRYEEGAVVRLERLEEQFSISDAGLSKPIIMACWGSDGRRYRQVVKRDEMGGGLRPDAVRMQVFETVNMLLAKDPQSRRRQLSIRTYRVVPVSPDSGVMEYVEDTRTLGSILADQNGMHERFNSRMLKGEWDSKKCREHLKEAKTSDERRQAYQDICRHFHPAFRFFFLEAYPDPALWYRRRLHFTRTVAISSIVGYILGIGDRHASNILMDTATAGIVHIDFGYTFEQVRACVCLRVCVCVRVSW